MIIGHSISNGEGVIQAIDEPAAAVLQRTQKQLVGLSYLAITHPSDVARNLNRIAALRPNGDSVCIRKRYIGGEGAIITLDVQVSRLGNSDAGYLVGTLSTSPVVRNLIDRDDMPCRMWRRARNLLDVIRARGELLGTDLFADYAWTTLLIVYLAEAESRIASVEMVADQLCMSRTTLARWIRALQSKSLIEPLDSDLGALQLTQLGIESLERLLATHPALEVG
jgi:hypothetical protein